MMIARETELYAPLKTFFEAQNFRVCSEVHDCDLVAQRGDELVIVEMKRIFNLDVVLQGIERKRVCHEVYVAIETPRGVARKRWRKFLRLCRLLGLGLLTVSFPQGRRRKNASALVEIVLEPAPYKPKAEPKRRVRLIAEFEKRSGDFNTGGCTRRKIVTAYRQEALSLAMQLQRCGPSKVKLLRDAAKSAKAQSILRNNFYGWFERVDRGIYALTQSGQDALKTYAHVVEALAKTAS
ncbi:MAG TPA: DUF2161 family putative PD-(D/E)XK-type phosphodiesterase [Planctomycetota bacterium]|nr:DUF2161 family putative PD-(D/E)XK-type phosphodiesterase [Planctomycetota bacterium]